MLQWMIFSAPHHPFLAQTLTNVVAVIKSIYKGKSVLLTNLSQKKNAMICATGPVVFTHSIRQIISTAPNDTLGYRSAGVDYGGIKAQFKAAWSNDAHYTSLMNEGVPLLKSLESKT